MNNRKYTKPEKPSYVTSLARELRGNATPAEKKLWNALRRNKLSEQHFRRQVPFGRYIFYFYRSGKKVTIEIDGDIHDIQKQYDTHRDNMVSAAGITILRFSNSDVMNNIQDVLDCIKKHF